MRHSYAIISIAIAVILIFVFPEFGYALDESNRSSTASTSLEQLVEQNNIQALKQQVPSVLSELALLYERSDSNQKTKIAQIYYRLGEKSEDARAALMKDIHTDDPNLRLQVQWALGRVSNDDVVVHELLSNMQNDPSLLFRDKAACALAHDQIHLTDRQKVKLFEGLIQALSDDKEDVRRIATLVLQIQTGQTKDYNPSGSSSARLLGIQAWKDWLVEYKKQIGTP